MAPPKLNPNIKTIRKTAEKFHKHRSGVAVARAELDKAILAGKEDGLTYKEIAREAGLSVAWVQGALQRSGYTPSARSPRSVA